MPKAVKILILILILLLLTAVGYFVWQKGYFSKKPETEKITTTGEALKLDVEKVATHLSKVDETKGVYWVRAFDMFWNEIEPKKGKLDWASIDEKIKEFNQLQIYPLIIIKPFTNWDQDACHSEKKYEAEFDPKKGGKVKVGKPCDMTAYANFLEKVVGRYDGNGQDDMLGLKIPVKYWEIMNEPEMQGGATGGMGEELKFFVGTSQDYLEILKTSYQAIKKADPEAKVLPAGMAGMQKNFQDFWQPIFQAGAGDYFDIANIHTISTDEKREDLYIMRFKKFLDSFGLSDRPIWITEVQFGRLTERPTDLKKFEILIAKASVFALAQGADKLFYIDNWLFWDEKEKELKIFEEKEEKTGPKISSEKLKSPTHKVYLNLVDKINQYDKIEKIKEDYQENSSDNDGTTSKIGQYKFILGAKTVYVLWGKAKLPAEIKGKIKVTDIYGEGQEMESADLTLSDEPVFVQPVLVR